MSGRAALTARVAARYRGLGRFAFHYVANKLRHDPLTGALLELGGAEGFGVVADLGCGRGQFAALLLEAGLARRVIGLDANPVLLGQARRALPEAAFEARLQDLAADPGVPPADTVLLLDVLYQLPTPAQRALLHNVSRDVRRLIVRTADPGHGVRGWLTDRLERAGRRVWPHAGALVNPEPPVWIVETLQGAGWSTRLEPCRAGTPFGNVLIVATRTTAG